MTTTAHTTAAPRQVYLGKPKPKRVKEQYKLKWASHGEVRALLGRFMRRYEIEGATALSRTLGAPLRQCFRWLSPLETNQNTMAPMFLFRVAYIQQNVEPDSDLAEAIKRGGYWEKKPDAK
jgi:hypothetical protein